MDVGIRELKAHLSEFVQRAAHGELITITDWGRPSAVLAPLPGRARLDEGIADGWIAPPVDSELPPPRRRHPSARRVLDVLAEDRGE